MDAEKIKGMAVVSIAEGTKLGRVDDLLFDIGSLRVAALRVSGDGQDFIIPFTGLKNIGVDAVTVENSQVTQVPGRGGESSAWAGLGKVKNLKVVDDAGTLLGTVSSIAVDAVTGQMIGLRAHKGGLLGLGGTSVTIDAQAIRSVGAEVITVAAGEGQAVPEPQG